MFDVDATLDSRRAVRETCLGTSTVCQQGSGRPADYPSSVPGLPEDRVLWSRGEVIALRRRGRRELSP